MGEFFLSKKSKVKSVKNRLRATDNKAVKGVPPVPDRFSRLFADAPLSIYCTFEQVPVVQKILKSA